MNPSSTENPVASTPKTPAARSPSAKKPPSGARRRTSSRAVTAIAHATAMIRNAQTTFTVAARGEVVPPSADHRRRRRSQPHPRWVISDFTFVDDG